MKLLEEMRKAEQRSGALGKELAASKGELQRLKAGGQDVVRRYEARRTQWGSLGCQPGGERTAAGAGGALPGLGGEGGSRSTEWIYKRELRIYDRMQYTTII